MSRRAVWVACCLLAAVLLAAPLAAQEPSGNTASTEADVSAERPWLSRLFHRYFDNRTPSGEALQGRAEAVAARYSRHAGKRIEVVIVNQVDGFLDRWETDRPVFPGIFSSLTRPLLTYTRDGVIRDYLLFAAGDSLEPYRLADSERMLRDLSYVSDARIQVVPLAGAPETVAVVVQTTDRWPLGADTRIVDQDQFDFSVYSVNVAGQGVEWNNQLLYLADVPVEAGYRGILRKENLGGSFLDGELEFEDSYRENQRRLSLDRTLRHPGIDVLGGAAWERTRVRSGFRPEKFQQVDLWAGWMNRLYGRRAGLGSGRPLLVPAVRFAARDYQDRPVVTADVNRAFHEKRQILTGIFFQSMRYYRTSYLYGLGETENIPAGFAARLTGGYEIGEFLDRACLALDTGAVFLRERGDFLSASVDFGGYLHNRRLEDGVLQTGIGYTSCLRGEGDYRTRYSGLLEYTLGLRRGVGDRLYLDPDSGLRSLPDRKVAGNQRLVGRWEARLFTPWSLKGFRFAWLGYLDLGVVGDEKAASLFQEKIHYDTGLGLSLRNPDLVFPSVQLRVGLRSGVERAGPRLVLAVGKGRPRVLPMPGPKPALLSYR